MTTKTSDRALRGLTLIELLVVVAIIATLTGLSLTYFITSQKRGRDARRVTDLNDLSTALEMYYSDKGVYPPHSGSWLDVESGTGNVLETSLVDDGYMKELPEDPISGQFYKYKSLSVDTVADQCYCLSAKVEISSNADLAPGCSSPYDDNYEFTLTCP